MKLVVSRRAVRRLREISAYIQDRNPAAASDVEQAIRNAFSLVAIYPNSGRLVHPDVRRFVVPRLPYLIFYRADEEGDTVTIITVRHAARRPLV